MSGFTLIELLVVVAIIAILAALLMTAIPGIMRRSDQAQDVGNIKTITQGLLNYVADNGKFPDGTAISEYTWDAAIFPYMGGEIPSDYNKNTGVTGASQSFYKAFKSPIDNVPRPDGTYARSYQLPSWVANMAQGPPGRPGNPNDKFGRVWNYNTGARSAQLSRPSKWVILSMGSEAVHRAENVLGKSSYGAGVFFGQGIQDWPYGRKAPYGFADGHVEIIELPEGGFKNPDEFMQEYADNSD